MCDQTKPYEPGTWVWCKAYNKIWWPGKVVDLADTPEVLQEFIKVKTNKKNLIAVVYFDSDKTHDVVTNMSKISLYNGPDKLKYIEKGYTLFKRQQRGGKILNNSSMKGFIEDVKSAEKSMGVAGDLNIFDKIKINDADEKAQKTKELIKELFVSEKDKKRQSLPLQRTSTTRLDKSKFKTIKKKVISPRVSTDMKSGVYYCHIKFGCQFKTQRFANLKRHMASHKTEKKDETGSPIKKLNKSSKSPASTSSKTSNKARSQTPKKQSDAKNKKSDTKKIKLQDELLKDWDEDDDVDESLNSGNGINDNANDSANDTANVIANDTSVTSVEASTSKTIFDFDENDDVTSDITHVSDLRHIKNSKQILENTESTIEQINNLEESCAASIKNESETDAELCLDVPSPSNAEVKIVAPTENREMWSCIGEISTPDWIKESSMTAFDEDIRKSSTIELHSKASSSDMDTIISVDFPTFEPTLFTTANDLPPVRPGYELREACVPINPNQKFHTDEELLKLPFIKKVKQLIASGQAHKVRVTFTGGKLIKDKN